MQKNVDSITVDTNLQLIGKQSIYSLQFRTTSISIHRMLRELHLLLLLLAQDFPHPTTTFNMGPSPLCALLVHGPCTFGACSVHIWCTLRSRSVHATCTLHNTSCTFCERKYTFFLYHHIWPQFLCWLQVKIN